MAAELSLTVPWLWPRGGRRRINYIDWVTLENQNYVVDISDEEVNSNITSSVVEKLNSLDATAQEVIGNPKIQKVPIILHENINFSNYYEPRVIAIGPYHHQNPNLKEKEKLKLELASLFIREHGLEKEVLYSKIKREIKDLREYYEEKATEPFTDDDLAWMFFVDGCALLHSIHCAVTGRFKEIMIKFDFLVFLKQDLFLLGNQLPYRVLVLLISCIRDTMHKWWMRKSIEKFIFSNIKAPGQKPKQLEHRRLPTEENIIHLLDLLRTRLLQFDDEEDHISCSMVQQLIKKLSEYIAEPLEIVKNLMECIVKSLENCFSSAEENDFENRFPSIQTFVRNVGELKAAGIRLRPSGTGCLEDITFNLGTLRLPYILVDDSTRSKFLNLIAYERSLGFSNDLEVSSYVAFLDKLIDQAQDVKELRDKQILHNLLGSDEEVAKLFNEISTGVVTNPNMYQDVEKKIQRRCDNKFMVSIAQFIHEHFQSPWSGIAFLAATIVVASTILQTVYTILGYYK